MGSCVQKEMQWLPNLQVWARLPSKEPASSRPDGAASTRSEFVSARPQNEVASGPSQAVEAGMDAGEQFYEAQEAPQSPVDGSEAEDTILSCSICAFPSLAYRHLFLNGSKQTLY